MIKVSNLVKAFKDQVILNGISFTINDGEVLALIGESGTGKSVLLKHLIGLLKPDAGTIEIDSVDITKLPEKELLKIRKKIGYLFQEGALYDFMDIFDNVAFPLREHSSLSEVEISKKVKETLAVVDLEGVENKHPSELSGGMKKRVGLARAIILDSKIIFCDEPTSGLDPIRSRDISDLIKNISKRLGCSMVFTSHDIENTFRIANRVILLKDGKIVTMGTPEEVKRVDNSFVQEFIR